MNPLRLTRRGDLVVAVLISIALLGAMWLAEGLGYLVTGVPG